MVLSFPFCFTVAVIMVHRESKSGTFKAEKNNSECVNYFFRNKMRINYGKNVIPLHISDKITKNGA